MPPARVIFYALTAGALVITARAVTGSPPSLGLVLAYGALYLAVLLSGVFFLRLRVFVDALVHGPADAQGVALTFDDGPDPTSTPQVLETLAQADVKAAFFLIARKAEEHPDLVRAIATAGHTIGLHSYAHDRLFALRGARRWRRDLRRGMQALERITGERPTLFRPPIGHTAPHAARVLRKLALRVIAWDVSGLDGVRADPRRVAFRVLRDVRAGSIVLLHDAAERPGAHEPACLRALPAILAGLKERSLPVVPLAEWLTPR